MAKKRKSWFAVWNRDAGPMAARWRTATGSKYMCLVYEGFEDDIMMSDINIDLDDLIIMRFRSGTPTISNVDQWLRTEYPTGHHQLRFELEQRNLWKEWLLKTIT